MSADSESVRIVPTTNTDTAVTVDEDALGRDVIGKALDGAMLLADSEVTGRSRELIVAMRGRDAA